MRDRPDRVSRRSDRPASQKKALRLTQRRSTRWVGLLADPTLVCFRGRSLPTKRSIRHTKIRWQPQRSSRERLLARPYRPSIAEAPPKSSSSGDRPLSRCGRRLGLRSGLPFSMLALRPGLLPAGSAPRCSCPYGERRAPFSIWSPILRQQSQRYP